MLSYVMLCYENIPPPAYLIFFVELKMRTSWSDLKWRLPETAAFTKVSLFIDQAIDEWRVCLNACFKAKGKHFQHMSCAVPQLSIIW